jgi:hypothetical protein
VLVEGRGGEVGPGCAGGITVEGRVVGGGAVDGGIEDSTGAGGLGVWRGVGGFLVVVVAAAGEVLRWGMFICISRGMPT